MRSDIVIAVILVIIVMIAIYSVKSEGFCNCTGMGLMTPKPTYYVYRPGDVSNYDNSGVEEPINLTGFQNTPSVFQQAPTIYQEQNLGWRTGMPYDYFTKHMTGNNWAAGSDPYPNSTSVPLVGLQNLYSNGGYVKNYGCVSTPYTKMLSNGTPQYKGPAGNFEEAPCPSANAYNLGVGVL